jgi:hypothetical protein
MHFLEGWGISQRLTYFVDFFARAIRRVVVLGAEAASSMIFLHSSKDSSAAFAAIFLGIF